LLGPNDGEHYERGKELVLEWEPAGPLALNEWYAVRMSWIENGQPAYGGTNTKDTYWVVPPEQYYGKADPLPARVYTWQVFVERVTIDDQGNSTGLPISQPSESRTFFWE
jgi:hypothetical protein